MATKQEWLNYLQICKDYHKAYAAYLKALAKYIKTIPDGEVQTTGEGSNPPTPPPPPPGFP